MSDPGLQPERTRLAWSRTALSLVVGSLLAVRVLSARVGLWTLVPTVAGLGLALVLAVLSRRRYRLHRARIDRPYEATPIRGGGLTLLTATLSASLGAMAVVLLLVG